MRRRKMLILSILVALAALLAVGGSAMASQTPEMTYNGTDMTYN